MQRNLSQLVLMLASCLWLSGCVAASEPSSPIIITQQTAGKSERFTQFELDVAFRKQIREDEKATDPEAKFDVCCVVFRDDIKMLSNVFTHFEKNVAADVNDYGVVVQENEKHYIVVFSERYRESTQYQVRGYWTPGISISGLPIYSYLVDRETLEILEFNRLPS